MRIYMQIFQLKFERHLSNRQIALTLNIARSTVNDLVVRFNNLNMQWPLPDSASLDALDKALLPGRNYRTQRVIPDWMDVNIDLSNKGVTKQLLWQEYQAEHGSNALGYTQFCNHYRAWKGQQRRSMRQTHKAGEKLFIDFCGPTMPIVNPDTGEIRRATIIILLALAFSINELTHCDIWINTFHFYIFVWYHLYTLPILRCL